MLVSSYYSVVYVPKNDKETDSAPSLLVKKRVCRKCKTVVASQVRYMLIHTANCRLTSIVSKKNALDQSRNRLLPTISHDSNRGEQRKLADAAKESDRGREARDAVITKRPLSQTVEERMAKKQKVAETSSRRTRSSKDCSASDCNRLNMAMIKALVWHNLPFRICDRQDRYDTPFVELLNELRPSYVTCCTPNSSKLRDTFSAKYYAEIRESVISNLDHALNGTYSHGTIMFDGWENVNGSSIVNVMLRVSSSMMASTATYFLDSVYTKEKKIDANKYVEIIEDMMKRFQGGRYSPYTGVRGVVSDSARSCVKAKAIFAKKHEGMVMLQDQAHATDLLMADLGKLTWIAPVLSKVNYIAQATRNNRKLLSRFKDLITAYNKIVKRADEAAEDLWSFMTPSELDEIDETLKSLTVEAIASTVRDQFNARSQRQQGWSKPYSTTEGSSEPRAVDEDPQVSGAAIPPVRRTAVTIKKTVKTRFASAETMLEGYLRSRVVLQRLIIDPDFEILYDGSRLANREKREKEYVQVITDDVFFGQVRIVHNIFRIIRRYLRVWDAEGSQVSEVVPATILLEYSLRRLSESSFLTAARKKEVLKCLERRYVTNYMPAFERHLSLYLEGSKDSLEDSERSALGKDVVKAYKQVHKMWDTLKKGPKNREILASYKGHSLRYWEDEQVTTVTDLERFALSTLGLCPSSCATERSFSHQGKIHTKQRNRLAPTVVRDLLFCKWNARVLRHLDRVEFDKEKDVGKVILGSFQPYEDFLCKTTGHAIFTEQESVDVLKLVLRKEARKQHQIENARKMLYESSMLYTFANKQHFSSISNVEQPVAISSAYDRSTIAWGHSEASLVYAKEVTETGSPSTTHRARTPRYYRAHSAVELNQILSGSKNRPSQSGNRRAVTDTRAGIDLNAESEIPRPTTTQKGPVSGVSARDALCDEDSVIMSVEMARQLMQERGNVSQPLGTYRAPSYPMGFPPNVLQPPMPLSAGLPTYQPAYVPAPLPANQGPPSMQMGPSPYPPHPIAYDDTPPLPFRRSPQAPPLPDLSAPQLYQGGVLRQSHENPAQVQRGPSQKESDALDLHGEDE